MLAHGVEVLHLFPACRPLAPAPGPIELERLADPAAPLVA